MSANRDWFARPYQGDRLSPGYGRTRLGDDAARRAEWLRAIAVGLIAAAGIVVMALL